MDYFLNALWSVVPTIILGLAFWFVMSSVLRADRKEREVFSKMEAEERAKRKAAAQSTETS